MAKLRIKDEHGKERVHELVDSVTTIGRASTNTIQVSDEKASRNHFRVEKSDGKYKVVDLGSTNGTRLNGSKISADTILKPKDTIQLGKTTFVFEDPEAVPEKMGDAFPAISGGETVEMDPIKLKEEDAQKPTATAEQAGPKFVLKVLEGKNPGKVYELGVQALTIGRHNSSTIQIIDDAASNYHAEINREPIGYVLTDLGSTNGTRVRQKNKSEFEKVVKTPLSVGMQIRVGKTLLEFENIGKPVEDEALFGTIALDPDKLEDKLVRPQKNNPALILLGLAMVLVFGIVVAAVIYFATPPSDKPPKIVDNRPPPNLENLIKNAEFDDGTDDDGNPKYFKVQRGAPGVKVSVVPDADRAGDAENKQKLGLQISKAGARSASARTIVETADSFGVEAGKSYEFSGWLRNDGDGLYGLHVTWIQGDRELEEGHIVLKEQQEWKEKTIVLTPPSWATRARAGVFAIGKDGKTFFDSLSFKEKPDASATAHPNVKFGGVAVNFEGTKGAFTAESQGETVLTGGSLVLVTQDNKAESELYSALKPEVKHDSSKVSYTGEMYDFALQEATNYSVQAQPGAAGVDLRVAMDAAQDNGSIPQLRFYNRRPAATSN
jgi:pSer/pThr/pTyr-binding forkhead associated (FHA) protein